MVHSRHREQHVESQVAGRLLASSRHAKKVSMIRAEGARRGIDMNQGWCEVSKGQKVQNRTRNSAIGSYCRDISRKVTWSDCFV